MYSKRTPSLLRKADCYLCALFATCCLRSLLGPSPYCRMSIFRTCVCTLSFIPLANPPSTLTIGGTRFGAGNRNRTDILGLEGRCTNRCAIPAVNLQKLPCSTARTYDYAATIVVCRVTIPGALVGPYKSKNLPYLLFKDSNALMIALSAVYCTLLRRCPLACLPS